MTKTQRRGEKPALALILLLAGFLSVYNIWNEGYSNEFYAASVKSMLVSWKNFFFVSLDPGGWVTVDKPPVSLWVQAAFAKVFGFYGWSILLPEALAAVAGVLILFHIVKRHFGAAAGLISALALALSPIFIVVSKTNNTDSVLILFMVLATWAMTAAADTGRLRHLILAAVLLGVAYNAKTLEAFLILPAFFVVYLFGTNLKWRTRAWHLAVAAVVLAAVSLSWSVAVDLTPASERPYVDNSTNNSELELAIGYNGIQRITGQNRGGSGTSAMFSAGKSGDSGSASGSTSGSTGDESPNGTMPTPPSDGGTQNDGNMQSPPSNGENQSVTGSTSSASGTSSGSTSDGNSITGGGQMPTQGMTGGGFGGGGGNSFNGGGSASPLRMFNTTLGGQDSWLLPFGLFTLLALILRMRAERDKEKRRRLLRGLLMWGVSVLTMVGYFSISSFFHPYYISAMAPFLAALVGIGAVEMRKLYKEQKIAGFILPVALAATLAAQIAILTSYPSFSKILIPLIAATAGVPTVLLLALKPSGKASGKLGAALTGVALAGLLIAPAVWLGYSVFTNSFNSSIPTAGPSAEETSFSRNGGFGMNGGDGERRDDGYGRTDSGSSSSGSTSSGSSSSSSGGTSSGSSKSDDSWKQNAGSFGNGGGFGGGNAGGAMSRSGSSEKLISFLEANNTGEKWLIAVPDASSAEPIILATGKPVIAIGGFSGNDNTMTVAKLEELVSSGQLKYFLVTSEGGRGGSASSEVTAWVEKYGAEVDSSKWSGSSSGSGGGTSGTLYDLSSYKTVASSSGTSVTTAK